MNYKRYLRSLYVLYKSFYKKSQWKGDERIFCLSIQKTGTTSFGDFFVHFGYPVVRSNLSQLRNWNAYWFLGYHKLIFWDPVFRNYQVFESLSFYSCRRRSSANAT